MQNRPFLSVMVPCFNVEGLVAQSVGSSLSQPCRDLEVLCLDDGSSDGTLSVLEGLAARDPRVRVVSHPNVGLGRNRNAGIPLMRGRWACFLDADDVLVPGWYTDGMRRFLASLSEAGVGAVLPSRAVADFGLERGALERTAAPDGVLPSSVARWLIPFEFSTLLYDMRVVQGEGSPRFGEGSPEVESAYRHRAVSLAGSVLAAQGLFFQVRRLNPSSITATWDPADAGVERAREWSKAALWHRREGDEEGFRRASSVVGRSCAREALGVRARTGGRSGECAAFLGRLRDAVPAEVRSAFEAPERAALAMARLPLPARAAERLLSARADRGWEAPRGPSGPEAPLPEVLAAAEGFDAELRRLAALAGIAL